MSIIVIINVAVTTCGIVLSILSSIVYFSVAPLRRDKKEDVEALFAVYCSCIVVLGALITIAALFTMLATLCPQIDTERCSKKIYPISLGVLSIALVMGSVLVMILSPMAIRQLEPSFIKMFGNSTNGSSNKDVDQLQRERECCGIRAASPFGTTETRLALDEVIFSNRHLPKSCCPNLKAEENCDWWKSYKQNCLAVFRYTFDRAINHIAMWALSVVTFLIVAIVLILCTTPR
ncbi:hypothetical protein GE061_005722 [Apolygus lucorum]|uniref:Tetraspanin n=1 Tax=Apolygus lucorum TaxID=248454 RepID=A0A8S9X122_APOLU|nr:hypothetical protein GE061_005722 [Apolygus lucorum]